MSFISQSRLTRDLAALSGARRTWAATLLAIAVTLPSSAHAIDCNAKALAAFVGEWTGRGYVQATPQAPKERTACRVQFSLTADGAIQSLGRCASPAAAREVSGQLACKNGSFNGPLFVVKGDDPARFVADKSDDDHIILLMEGIDPRSGKMERARLHIDFESANVMTVRVTRSAWTAVSLRYRRKE